MEVRFEDDELKRLAGDASFDGGKPRAIVKGFRKLIQLILSAKDERHFYGFRGVNFEKLRGARAGEYSMRINDQYRLILTFDEGKNGKVAVVKAIEDYH